MRLKYFTRHGLLVIVFASLACEIQYQKRGPTLLKDRQALFEGNNQAALGYFQAAAQVDPNYLYGTDLQGGTLSFLGRAQYLNGDYTRARSDVGKALAQHKDDNVARRLLPRAYPGSP
jgi:tetratricopeptide (TPR) repeat protein